MSPTRHATSRYSFHAKIQPSARPPPCARAPTAAADRHPPTRETKWGSQFGVNRDAYEGKLGFQVAQTPAPSGSGPRSCFIQSASANEFETTLTPQQTNIFGDLPATLAHAQARGMLRARSPLITARLCRPTHYFNEPPTVLPDGGATKSITAR